MTIIEFFALIGIFATLLGGSYFIAEIWTIIERFFHNKKFDKIFQEEYYMNKINQIETRLYNLESKKRR